MPRFIVSWSNKDDKEKSHFIEVRGYGAEILSKLLDDHGYDYTVKAIKDRTITVGELIEKLDEVHSGVGVFAYFDNDIHEITYVDILTDRVDLNIGKRC